jgi:hypothetical protein
MVSWLRKVSKDLPWAEMIDIVRWFILIEYGCKGNLFLKCAK